MTVQANFSLTNQTNTVGPEIGPTEHIVWTVAYSLVAIAVITSNCLTIATFTRPTFRRKHVHFLLINLAVTDLMVGGVTIPLLVWIENIHAGTNNLATQFFGISHWISILASTFTIVVISLDRLHAVGWPLKHRALTISPYIRALSVAWFVAGIISAVITFGDDRTITRVQVASMSVSIVILVVAYTALWILLQNSARQARRAGANQHVDGRLTRTLLIVTVMFVITCGLPYTVLRAVVIYACRPQHPSWCAILSSHGVAFSRLLLYSNSFCNPVIYSVRDGDFRQTLKGIFRKTTSRRENSLEHHASHSVRPSLELNVLH